MDDLIKRLERVIQTGAPDKDGMHPISAEAVLEVVKGLSEHGTNLAEVGTEAITKQQAIDALRKLREEDIEDYGCEIPEGFNQDHLDRATFAIKQLPPIQPKLLQPWEVLAAQSVLSQPAEPKRGKWIRDGHHIRCDQCGMYMCDTDREGDRIPTEFCPNCGAKMEVDDE